ncbi:WecB/TagA/CpsF family glycosyltransferase [Enterovibrio sp. ZSDZ42]|uniref:WecB/TagA/CpsF family glycosyltransferase n=1 Tax=Enterovibrio gelatinilyticus TaxID=2899819 RepID=A0ABT5QYX4_9GAMM|nr:WecB/TagA/CpsF family glycosyltransferase [Enterovibrio sp. ZSDZ42]MDD1792974.1 WecB/TagA/CpsF family glycosyltransferase [Enterovibrio sp. ZSDZ42]
MKRIEFLETPMDISTMSDTVSHIESKIIKGEFIQHVVVNVAKIVNMRKNPTLAESVRECDVINIDGMGVVFGARFLGHTVPERVAGIDLFHQLLEMSVYRGFPIFLLGATQEVVSTTNKKLLEMYPDLNIAGFHDGYFWHNEQEVVNKIRESGAKLLFVAITSPKKENFINKWKDQLGVDFVMGVGGTFDVVAGKVSRAPTWMQEAGLEWLYRVFQEPRRMWKRYLVTNSKYALLLMKERFSSK